MLKAIGDLKTGVGNDCLSAESFKYADKSICVFFVCFQLYHTILTVQVNLWTLILYLLLRIKTR